jgi:hypothetical protein
MKAASLCSHQFEGCTSLPTPINVIVHVREENRTAEEKRKAARFQELGPHMTCPEVQRILSER